MAKNSNSSNDQRSNAMNPNHPSHQANNDNRSRQLNAEDPKFGGKPETMPSKAETKSDAPKKDK